MRTVLSSELSNKDFKSIARHPSKIGGSPFRLGPDSCEFLHGLRPRSCCQASEARNRLRLHSMCLSRLGQRQMEVCWLRPSLRALVVRADPPPEIDSVSYRTGCRSKRVLQRFEHWVKGWTPQVPVYKGDQKRDPDEAFFY